MSRAREFLIYVELVLVPVVLWLLMRLALAVRDAGGWAGVVS